MGTIQLGIKIQIVFSFDILDKNLKTNKMNLYNQAI